MTRFAVGCVLLGCLHVVFALLACVCCFRGLVVVLIVASCLLFAGLVVALVVWFGGAVFRVVVVICFGGLGCVQVCTLWFGLLFVSLFVWLLFCLWLIVYDSWFRLAFYRFGLGFD